MSIEAFKTSNEKKQLDKFDPDKRIEVKDNWFEKVKNVFNPEKRMEKFYIPYEERVAQTPTSLERWEGKRGESLCLPTNRRTKEALEKSKLKGIEYRNGIPDFGFEKCAEVKVKIEMTPERYVKLGNFEQADAESAKQWNREHKEGRDNWTAREVKEYRKKNSLSWHECSDREHCYLIPQVIHNDFSHIGGVAECKRRDEIMNNKKGVIFDE